MVKKTPSRLSIDTPIIREHIILDTFVAEKTPTVTIAKYSSWQKNKDGGFDEILKSIFVENPDHFDLRGKTLKFTTEIL